ncbi:hypothetical protein [Anaeromyxobacter oryzae]|uniref:Uncharacterized protein n=1 Tax=Anaeromyxobacter oryzae TaxID=2918170 RepID=A0ABM7X0R0_9BACT|nr:hypothetical protein [Anaeromyxobacter oryzae]BDG05316.1 hypothetical protein AMOR_43120 [Anaeromyxobacter oryzae]
MPTFRPLALAAALAALPLAAVAGPKTSAPPTAVSGAVTVSPAAARDRVCKLQLKNTTARSVLVSVDGKEVGSVPPRGDGLTVDVVGGQVVKGAAVFVDGARRGAQVLMIECTGDLVTWTLE